MIRRRKILAILAGAALVTSLSPGWLSAARVDVVPWSTSLVPPPFAGTEDPRGPVPFLPDSLRIDQRPELQSHFVEKVPTIDGDLGDWPVVRWRDARGIGTLVRGRWSGPGDGSIRFAVLWSVDGMTLGAEVRDDSLLVSNTETNPERVESVLLYLGSAAPGVTRYWRSSERAFRVWADGRLEAWTRQHEKRPVLFDPSVFGVRGAARVVRQGELGGRIIVELFVPWDAVFPALPHPQAALLGNVLFEDLDADAGKLFAWSARRQSDAASHHWAALSFRGGPPDGTWLSSVGSFHYEPDQPLEWSLLRWGGAQELDATLRVRSSVAPVATETFALEHDASIVRVHDLPEPQLPWPGTRRVELAIGTRDDIWREHVVHAAPTYACVDSGLTEIAALTANRNHFPDLPDVEVRLQIVADAVRRLRDWYTMRHQPTGILATRAASWVGLEPRLEEVQLLRDAMIAGADAPEVRGALEARWPQRQANGHPVGLPVLRGQRSPLDGSTQPYVMYVPTKLAAETAPLLVVLHTFGEGGSQPFTGTALAQEAEARGWFAVAPRGRGDVGFLLAGERDVLDVLADVREQFPIDATRIYLAGYGMGGTGAWLLSLRHSGLFAAVTVVSGYGDMDQPDMFQRLSYHPEELFFYETQNPHRLIRPDLKVAYRIVHGEADPIISVVHARIMEDRLSEYEIPNELVIVRNDSHGRDLFNETLGASLDYMAQHRRATPGVSNPDWFGGVGGPIATVFSRGAFAVIHGTQPLVAADTSAHVAAGGDASVTGPEADVRAAHEAVREWFAHFGGRPPVFSDADVTPQMQRDYNLVVVGDPRTNRLLREARDRLPVRYEGEQFEIAGVTYDFAKVGIAYAIASPLSPGKTWVVLSGMDDRIAGFTKPLFKLGADYVVADDAHQLIAVGHFRGLGSFRPSPRNIGGDSR